MEQDIGGAWNAYRRIVEKPSAKRAVRMPLDADGARLLFQVVSEGYERQSVIVTTNPGFSRWGQTFGDEQMAAAVIDRVVHHGRLLRFRGTSYRMRHALMSGEGVAQRS